MLTGAGSLVNPSQIGRHKRLGAGHAVNAANLRDDKPAELIDGVLSAADRPTAESRKTSVSPGGAILWTALLLADGLQSTNAFIAPNAFIPMIGSVFLGQTRLRQAIAP